MRDGYKDATGKELSLILSSGDTIEGISTRFDLNNEKDAADDGEIIEDIMTSVHRVRFQGGLFVQREKLDAKIRFEDCLFEEDFVILNCHVLRSIVFLSCKFQGAFKIMESTLNSRLDFFGSSVKGALSMSSLKGIGGLLFSGGQIGEIKFHDVKSEVLILSGTRLVSIDVKKIKINRLGILNCEVSKSSLIDQSEIEIVEFLGLRDAPPLLFRDLKSREIVFERVYSEERFEIHAVSASMVRWSLSDFKKMKIASCNWKDVEFECDRTTFAPLAYTDFAFPETIQVGEAGETFQNQRLAAAYQQFAASALAQLDKASELKFKAKGQLSLLKHLVERTKNKTPSWNSFAFNHHPIAGWGFRKINHDPLANWAWEGIFWRFAFWRNDNWNIAQLWLNRITNNFGLSYRRSLFWFAVVSLLLFAGYICAVDEFLEYSFDITSWRSGIEYVWQEHKQQYFYFINPIRKVGFLCPNADCGEAHWSAGLWDFVSRIVLV